MDLCAAANTAIPGQEFCAKNSCGFLRLSGMQKAFPRLKTVDRPILQLLPNDRSHVGAVFRTVSFRDLSRPTPSGTRQSSLDHESCESGAEDKTDTEGAGASEQGDPSSNSLNGRRVLNAPSVGSIHIRYTVKAIFAVIE